MVRYNSKSYLSEGIFYSPMRQQWLVAFDTNGTIKGLIPRNWYSNKRDALLELKQALEFRLGLIADCTELYKRLDKINLELKRIGGAE